MFGSGRLWESSTIYETAIVLGVGLLIVRDTHKVVNYVEIVVDNVTTSHDVLVFKQ